MINMVDKKIIIGIIVLILIIIIILNLKKCKKKVENFNVKNNGFKIKILYRNPDIILIENFLTEEECDYIIKLGDYIKKSEVCDKNGSRPDKSRTSMTAHIGKKF